jgi:hypothetical protein
MVASVMVASVMVASVMVAAVMIDRSVRRGDAWLRERSCEMPGTHVLGWGRAAVRGW